MAGDKSWLPYHELSHLRVLTDYFKAIGMTGIENLRRCHTPNRFGTVNMEDNVNIKRS